jgi:hypothetical protein
MTEEEWLACTDPMRMLSFLNQRLTDRKMRLFAVACCHRIWHLLTDERSRQAVETAEQYADGRATDHELQDAWHLAFQEVCISPGHWDNASLMAAKAARRPTVWFDTSALPSFEQATVLHDLFGPFPFRPLSVERSLLDWSAQTIPKLAQQFYEEKNWQDMPILADALEGAGCDNTDILGHCRRPGPHVRGCWVLDLILGKN